MITDVKRQELIFEHFFYEVGELRFALLLDPREFNNIRHDAFLLHARALRELFFPSDKVKRRKDDAYADQFVEGWNLRLPPGLTKIDERAGKEIMHLTYSRIAGTPEHKKWNFKKYM